MSQPLDSQSDNNQAAVQYNRCLTALLEKRKDIQAYINKFPPHLKDEVGKLERFQENLDKHISAATELITKYGPVLGPFLSLPVQLRAKSVASDANREVRGLSEEHGILPDEFRKQMNNELEHAAEVVNDVFRFSESYRRSSEVSSESPHNFLPDIDIGPALTFSDLYNTADNDDAASLNTVPRSDSPHSSIPSFDTERMFYRTEAWQKYLESKNKKGW